MRPPIWFDEAVALVIHDRQLVGQGGAEGLRDKSLLRSGLARPQHHLAYGRADIVKLAAMYMAGIVKNHPFVDGNKRTGFVIGILFLELNGYRFGATEEAAAPAVLALAAGTIEEGYGEFLRANSKRLRTSASLRIFMVPGRGLILDEKPRQKQYFLIVIGVLPAGLPAAVFGLSIRGLSLQQRT